MIDENRVAAVISGLLQYNPDNARGKLEHEACELLARQQEYIKSLRRELSTVAQVGGAALGELHGMCSRNPAPDAAAPMSSGIYGTMTVTR